MGQEGVPTCKLHMPVPLLLCASLSHATLGFLLYYLKSSFSGIEKSLLSKVDATICMLAIHYQFPEI